MVSEQVWCKEQREINPWMDGLERTLVMKLCFTLLLIRAYCNVPENKLGIISHIEHHILSCYTIDGETKTNIEAHN